MLFFHVAETQKVLTCMTRGDLKAFSKEYENKQVENGTRGNKKRLCAVGKQIRSSEKRPLRLGFLAFIILS